MESKLFFESQDCKLEGVFHKAGKTRAVVISHPHPLYGGNMDNPVVLTIAQAFINKGVAALRFNFRGTCGSQGMFDDGIGEQADVLAALACLEKMGFEQRYLAGYSFGARMNAMVMAGGCRVQDHIMVSPPAGFMSFDEIQTMPDTGLIVTGDRDEIAPEGIIRGHVDRWGIDPEFVVIEGCDHFYSGGLDDLQGVIAQYLSKNIK